MSVWMCESFVRIPDKCIQVTQSALRPVSSWTKHEFMCLAFAILITYSRARFLGKERVEIMKVRHVAACVTALLLPLTALLLAFSSGPDPRMTGGFGEQTCLQCHNSFQLNEGRTRGGVFYLQGVPERYRPGETYPITVVIGQPGQQRWGFEISARLAGNGQQAGELVPSDAQSQVRTAGRVQYAFHTATGTRQGEQNGPVTFGVDWTAPQQALGDVLFNASGNAADGDGNTTGDFVYTASAYSMAAAEVDMVPLAQEHEAATEPRPGRRLNNEPRVAHMGAPVDLNRGNVEVLIQHRFLGPIVDDGSLDAGNAFGLDHGANINLGIAYALTDRLSVGVSRERFDQRVGFSGTVELLTREESPFKAAFRGGMEGERNFGSHYTGFIEVPVQWDYKVLRLNATPIAVFNSRSDLEAEFRPDPVNGDSNHTFALGVGTDIALNRRLSLVGEYIPRLGGFGGFGIDRASVTGGLKIRTRRHVFHVLITNNRFMSPSRYAVNATTTDYAFGFNIYRRFGR